MKGPSSNHPGRALVTHSRSWQALAVIRNLGRRGIEIVAGDEFKITPGALSKYTTETFEYRSWIEDPDGFLDDLSSAIERFRPSDGRPYVLMPVHRETQVIASRVDRLPSGIAVPLADAESFRAVSHKARLWRLASAAGVKVPAAWFPRDASELERRASEIPLPAFVKLPSSVAGLGVERVETRAELLDAFTRLDERKLSDDDAPMVQEEATGDDYCTMALCNRGKTLHTLTYKNVLTFPPQAGQGAVRETVNAPGLAVVVERLMAAAHWHGMAQVDFRWSGIDGDEPQVLEVNPRFSAGLFQAIESGVDFPWHLFQLACGIVPGEPPEVDFGTRTETPLLGLLATLTEIADSGETSRLLDEAWQQSRRELTQGSAWGAVSVLLEGLRESLDIRDRLPELRRLLDENKSNVSLLLDADDPLPVLGLVYPLTIFLRHGRITQELLAGADEPS